MAEEPRSIPASRRVEVRVPAERYAAWEQAATQAGLNLSEFVRSSVEDRIAGRTPGALTQGIAHAVSADLLPEIERALALALANGRWEPPQEPPSPAFVAPRAWDPSCYTADLHRQGVVCTECGGSFLGGR